MHTPNLDNVAFLVPPRHIQAQYLHYKRYDLGSHLGLPLQLPRMLSLAPYTDTGSYL